MLEAVAQSYHYPFMVVCTAVVNLTRWLAGAVVFFLHFKPCFCGCCMFNGARVADKMSRLMQCQAKANSVQDILQLLTCRGSSKCSTAAPAAADDAGSAAAAALRGCLGTATLLLQALAAHKKEVFQAWQVRLHST